MPKAARSAKPPRFPSAAWSLDDQGRFLQVGPPSGQPSPLGMVQPTGGPGRGGALAFVATPDQPRPQGNSKQLVMAGGRPRLVASKGERRFRAQLVELLQAVTPAPAPFWTPVRLDVHVYLAPPASWPKALRTRAVGGDPELPPVRGAREGTRQVPDRCNLVKLLEDALQAAGWLGDDSYTVAGELSKGWGRVPGYALSLAPWPYSTVPAWLDGPGQGLTL